LRDRYVADIAWILWCLWYDFLYDFGKSFSGYCVFCVQCRIADKKNSDTT
jgi:hypothetical protein